MIFDELKQSVRDSAIKAEAVAQYYDQHQSAIAAVATAFQSIEVIRAVVTDEDVELTIAGDKAVLNAIFRAFRQLGYKPDSRPDSERMTSFTTWFRSDQTGCSFWLSFTATHCTRVKAGTETREVDIYEIVCE